MGATLRIVSANLFAGSADPEAFAGLAERLGADVVAVQELSPDQAAALAVRFPYGLLAPRSDFDGGGIALARPAQVEPLDLAERHSYRVTLDPGAWPELTRSLEILNVHLYAPHADRGLGLWLRWRQFQRLAEQLARPALSGRVVVGDFNATPLWPVYWRMAARMEDAARVVARREGRRPQRTWSRRPGGAALLRIDHGFVAQVRPERFQVVPVEGSDHRAIVLDVALDEARDAQPA